MKQQPGSLAHARAHCLCSGEGRPQSRAETRKRRGSSAASLQRECRSGAAGFQRVPRALASSTFPQLKSQVHNYSPAHRQTFLKLPPFFLRPTSLLSPGLLRGRGPPPGGPLRGPSMGGLWALPLRCCPLQPQARRRSPGSPQPASSPPSGLPTQLAPGDIGPSPPRQSQGSPLP